VVGHLQLVRSVTPIEVKLMEPKATTNQQFDQIQSKECDNVSAENLPPVASSNVSTLFLFFYVT
jgi:hypothetical protein